VFILIKMDIKKHGEVIIKYQELNSKLKAHGLFINTWESMAIAKISEPHNHFLANDLDSIEEVEQWVNGFLYGLSLNAQ
jgi:hypothetical protein